MRKQTAPVIAKLLVEQIICRHGVPNQLLSDRGTNFLSKLMSEVYSLMGIQKLNTTAYHPQTDGLVERFNRTLTEMLSKTVEKNGKDWDQKLPYVLFAYRSSPQSSTKESPFFLLYGRDPKLPIEAALTLDPVRFVKNTGDYKVDLTQRLSEAWDLAKQQVKEAQRQQKQSYDRHTRDASIQPGDRVFIYMPAAKQNLHHKFARPFYGPYRVLSRDANTLTARPVNQPSSKSIRVSLSRVRLCPSQIEDVFWSGNKSEDLPTAATSSSFGEDSHESSESMSTTDKEFDNCERDSSQECTEDHHDPSIEPETDTTPTPWSTRLRTRPVAKKNQRGR